MATVRTLIKAALRKAGVLATGQTPTASEEQDAFDDMKRMLEVWSTKQIYVHASAEDNFALVAGTVSYTMGTAGTASTISAATTTSPIPPSKTLATPSSRCRPSSRGCSHCCRNSRPGRQHRTDWCSQRLHRFDSC